MRRVVPKVFLVGETQANPEGIKGYLEHIGAPEWTSDASSGSELITEIMSRGCYNSFGTELNANLTRVREGNTPHLANVIKTKHGSVAEHAVVNFIFCDVSRVFTHELVRHRVGTAMSQQSLRYVRLTDLGLWLPEEFEHDDKIRNLFETTFQTLEKLQLEMAETFDLDNMKDFDRKKKLTSFMRRIAPIGLATNIGFSMNHRSLRFLLALRTHRSAEVEIRLAFAKVGEIAQESWPNLYADFKTEEVDGIKEFTSDNWKI